MIERPAWTRLAVYEDRMHKWCWLITERSDGRRVLQGGGFPTENLARQGASTALALLRDIDQEGDGR